MTLCMGDVIATSGAASSRIDLAHQPAPPNVKREFVPQLGLERLKRPCNNMAPADAHFPKTMASAWYRYVLALV